MDQWGVLDPKIIPLISKDAICEQIPKSEWVFIGRCLYRESTLLPIDCVSVGVKKGVCYSWIDKSNSEDEFLNEI